MVQILPYVQSPLEQLTPYINQAATDIAGGFKQRSAAKRLEALMNPESVQGANDSAPNSSSTPRTTTQRTSATVSSSGTLKMEF